MKKLIFLLAFPLLSCTKNDETVKLVKSDRDYNLMKQLVRLADLSVPPVEKQSGHYYCATPEPGKDDKSRSLRGKIISDLEEETLLTTVYGSCYKAGDQYVFNFGPQMWDEHDSVYMKVDEMLGNDTLKIVFLKGDVAITCVNHNHYNETAMLLKKTGDQWKITDAYVDQGTIDAEKPEMMGIYGGRVLLKYNTFGIYAGGVDFGSEQFIWLKPDSLTGPSVDFITGSSNTASDQCMSDFHEECDCYSKQGKVKFTYNKAWNCLEFVYDFEMTRGDCEMKKARTKKIRQKWYMSKDSCFLANGPELGEWGNQIFGKVNLGKEEIKKRLKVL